jgi:hypothetical protein
MRRLIYPYHATSTYRRSATCELDVKPPLSYNNILLGCSEIYTYCQKCEEGMTQRRETAA